MLTEHKRLSGIHEFVNQFIGRKLDRGVFNRAHELGCALRWQRT